MYTTISMPNTNCKCEDRAELLVSYRQVSSNACTSHIRHSCTISLAALCGVTASRIEPIRCRVVKELGQDHDAFAAIGP
jgi:hypothetical protein